jgi:hypothetical protein
MAQIVGKSIRVAMTTHEWKIVTIRSTADFGRKPAADLLEWWEQTLAGFNQR